MKPLHLTDGDLIRLADGEMKPREASRRRAHLEACWECRSRQREIENTVGDFVRLRREAMEPVLPSAGARALLRARLAELTVEPPAPAPRLSSWHVWHALPALAAGLVAVVAMVITFGGTVSADGPKPRVGLTPGETRPVNLTEVCAAPESDDRARELPEEMKRLVFAAYGMDPAQAGAYEVDYLITPELGGAYTVRNLWPQPYSVRWNARVKDKLEHRLHQLVCQGSLDLATAQHDIATDWIGAYRKYVSSSLPR